MLGETIWCNKGMQACMMPAQRHSLLPTLCTEANDAAVSEALADLQSPLGAHGQTQGQTIKHRMNTMPDPENSMQQCMMVQHRSTRHALACTSPPGMQSHPE